MGVYDKKEKSKTLVHLRPENGSSLVIGLPKLPGDIVPIKETCEDSDLSSVSFTR